jgi:hypothetical protein
MRRLFLPRTNAFQERFVMKRFATIATAALFLLPAAAFAQVNNVGSCGWGSKLFDGQSGVVPQGLAGSPTVPSSTRLSA